MVKLNLTDKDFTTLEGIDLTGVTELSCSFNRNLNILPELPEGLEILICHLCQIKTLPKLPSTLVYLDCFSNRISSLDVQNLKNLTYLDCSGNSMKWISELPLSLKHFDCAFNNFSSLPNLDISNVEFLCNDYNDLNDDEMYDLNKIKLKQHNNKRRKLGLESAKELPSKEILLDIHDRWIASRYEPGGDVFEQCRLLASEN